MVCQPGFPVWHATSIFGPGAVGIAYETQEPVCGSSSPGRVQNNRADYIFTSRVHLIYIMGVYSTMLASPATTPSCVPSSLDATCAMSTTMSSLQVSMSRHLTPDLTGLLSWLCRLWHSLALGGALRRLVDVDSSGALPSWDFSKWAVAGTVGGALADLALDDKFVDLELVDTVYLVDRGCHEVFNPVCILILVLGGRLAGDEVHWHGGSPIGQIFRHDNGGVKRVCSCFSQLGHYSHDAPVLGRKVCDKVDEKLVCLHHFLDFCKDSVVAFHRVVDGLREPGEEYYCPQLFLLEDGVDSE